MLGAYMCIAKCRSDQDAALVVGENKPTFTKVNGVWKAWIAQLGPESDSRRQPGRRRSNGSGSSAPTEQPRREGRQATRPLRFAPDVPAERPVLAQSERTR
jgi:hypothetical protein